MLRDAVDGVERIGNNRYEGYCADLAEAVCRVLGIEYELKLVSDGKYGEKRSNGTWSGMVGELTRKVRAGPEQVSHFQIVNEVHGDVAQWLGRRSVADGLSLMYA